MWANRTGHVSPSLFIQMNCDSLTAVPLITVNKTRWHIPSRGSQPARCSVFSTWLHSSLHGGSHDRDEVFETEHSQRGSPNFVPWGPPLSWQPDLKTPSSLVKGRRTGRIPGQAPTFCYTVTWRQHVWQLGHCHHHRKHQSDTELEEMASGVSHTWPQIPAQSLLVSFGQITQLS